MLERKPNWEYDAEGQAGPGALLRAAREKDNLTVADVASNLRINEQMLADIEADDFSHAPAVIYVRGYLRAYARMVDLSAMEVLQAFDAMGWQDASGRDHADIGRAKLRAERRGVQRAWLLVVAALVVILLVVLFWAI